MAENMTETTASSPPSFMTEDSNRVAEAREKANREVQKEASAQDEDQMLIRLEMLRKSTVRIKEMAEYLGKVDAVIARTLPDFVALHPLGQVLDNVVNFEDEFEQLIKQTKSIAERISYVREVSFPARLDADESKTFTSKDTNNRVTRTARVFASIISDPTGDILKKAYDWLRSNDLGSLIKETVNSSSLSATAKELMENGRELPDDLFRIHTKDGVSITRGKKKG